MDEADDQPKKTKLPNREISNANLFAEDIVFSDTEKILFSEDLHESHPNRRDHLMDGKPEDRYTPSKKINEGGMKAIWEVDDHRTARKVAMALFQDSKIASEKDIEAFLYEARLTANLQHPNIIPVYDIAIDESGNPYFTMKALKGETLGEILAQLRSGKIAAYNRTRLLGIFLKVCNAIDYAHAKGVIHLDLKPSNIIVGEFGDVHVLDWGLAMLVTHPDAPAETRDIVGGTPGYMAPEQTKGSSSDISFQTDVYMLGAILYEILTYHCPIEGETTKEVLQKTVRGEVPEPTLRAPEQKIPSPLSAMVRKAMQPDPSERYTTVAALIHDLHQFQDGFATRAENPTFITHLALLVKRHKMAVGLIAASAAVITVVLVNSFSQIKQSESVAIDTLATLQEKNDYIAATAKQVAPDYLNLMLREENEYEFNTAEHALNTSLAFDPSLKKSWIQKGRILLCQQQFKQAQQALSETPSAPLRLAEKYINQEPVADSDLPQLVRDFKNYDMSEGIPRLFYHLNRAPFDPESRFVALAKSLQILNPKNESLHFSYQAADGGGWIIDASNNPYLDDLSPLCGLEIRGLNINRAGTPNLKLLTESGMKELQVSGTALTHLFELDQLASLRSLNISRTQIRNLANIVKYPKLTALDISGIDGLAISQHLIWCRNLRTLTVSESFKDNPTIRALANRGVIIIYAD